MSDELEKRIREVERDLEAHLRECILQNKMVWHELRSLKGIQWAAVTGIIATLAIICGSLLRVHLHL
jgi:hypothetical protein